MITGSSLLEAADLVHVIEMNVFPQEARCYERLEKAVECDSECRRIQREKEEVRVSRRVRSIGSFRVISLYQLDCYVPM